MRKKQFFSFSFQNFFDFWAKIFQTFGQIFKICQNYLLRVQRNNLWLEKFFKSFDSFWIFCRNLWHGSQISIYVSRVKIAEETVFWFFFSDFFRILSEKSFRLSAKKLQKVVKTTFCVSTGTTCGFKYFKKFWTVLDFLQKLLAWFSKFYLRNHSKNCVGNSFLIFLFRFFSDFEWKIFQTFGQKNFKKLSKLPSACPQEQLVALNFLESFEPFWIFYRNFWHGSQNYIYVSRVKIASETVFLFFFSDFFRILSENFFRLLAEKRQDFVKITFYVSSRKICGLIFFFKF